MQQRTRWEVEGLEAVLRTQRPSGSLLFVETEQGLDIFRESLSRPLID